VVSHYLEIAHGYEFQVLKPFDMFNVINSNIVSCVINAARQIDDRYGSLVSSNTVPVL